MSKIGCGSPEPLGVTLTTTGANVAVFSAHATAIHLCLFDAAGEVEVRRVALPERTGDVFHGHVADLAENTRYGLRAQGPFEPSEGHRFNPAKLLLDPHALAIDRPFRLHASMFDRSERGHRDTVDSAAAMPKAILLKPAAAEPTSSFVPWSRGLVYELHVRGFTRLHPDIPAASRGSFAGLAHPASIAHLNRLGVTAVEVLPPAAWIEERHLAHAGLTNYWGYNPVALLAPDPRLAPGGWSEILAAVKTLEAAGIETIIDIVLNHTGEGDEAGPTLSLRGLDNASYYRLLPHDPSRYVDDSGCGNCLALDHQPALRLAMDALRAWATLGGVHGFRFDLATALGRRDSGFDPSAPMLAAIAQDPILRKLKMIAEPWDVGPSGYQIGSFPGDWGEWNDRFRDDVRKFWRGDANQLGPMATRLAGSDDRFGAKRRPSRGINYIVAHDGFTLADVVSYKTKHNDANGENGRDGSDENFSWNNGVEGATRDAAVLAGRLADQRALLAILLLARGTPMLAMGAELGQTQGGNNNAYAQDNPTSWIDWAGADAGLIAWTARIVGIRRDHPAFSRDRFLTGAPSETSLLADVEWRRPNGTIPDQDHWHAGRTLMAVFAAAGIGDAPDDRVALVLNAGSFTETFVLPPARGGHVWQKLADSANEAMAAQNIEANSVAAPPRAVLVLAELADQAAAAGRDRLSATASATLIPSTAAERMPPA